MRRLTWLAGVFGGLLPLAAWAAPKADAAPALDTAKIEALTGAKGKLDEKAGVFKVSAPRSDLKVVSGGVHITPPMGLTSWAAFTRAGSHTAVMGDIVLTEDQVNQVMSAALDNGLEVTALHNHFFGDSPKMMFMHIGGMGDLDKLATGVGVVFAKIKETSGAKGEVAQSRHRSGEEHARPEEAGRRLRRARRAR